MRVTLASIVATLARSLDLYLSILAVDKSSFLLMPVPSAAPITAFEISN